MAGGGSARAKSTEATDVAPRPFSGEQIEIHHRGQRATIVELGAGLRRYSVGGREIIDGYGRFELPPAAHGQALMPWPNRLADGSYEFAGTTQQLPLDEPELSNAIHGLVRWQNWSVAEQDDARVLMVHTLHAREGYPFTLALAIEYALDDEGLHVNTSARNVGRDPCPFAAGAHPYVSAGTPLLDSCWLRAPGRTWFSTDARSIPIGSEPVTGTKYDFRRTRRIGDTILDTAFADLERDDDGIARVELAGDAGEPTVTVWLDASYRYLMLFTGDTIAQPERRRCALGVEPMTCAPNAFRTGEGLLVLRPGEDFTGSWGVTAA